jgi:acyl-CoA thioester hydrolase
MDTLGHVNNVTYVDYLQEARIDMFALHAGFSGVTDLAEGVVVVRHEVEFVAPLVFRRRPVLVDVWITDLRPGRFTMAYEVYDDAPEGEGGRRVHLRASSVLAPYVFAGEHPRRLTDREREVLGRFLEPAEERSPLVPGWEGAGREGRHGYPLKVRFSDVDVFRHVNNVKYFEYFQEARIQYFMDLRRPGDDWSEHVVARTDVQYRRPMLFRLAPYRVHSWISRLGDRSFTMSAEIRDDGADAGAAAVLARANVVMVTFDRATQRSAAMAPGQRRRLTEELGPGPGPAPGC